MPNKPALRAALLTFAAFVVGLGAVALADGAELLDRRSPSQAEPIQATGKALLGAAVATEPAARILGTRSGLPWASGAYVPGSHPAGFERFGEWRGRPLDVAVFWVDRATWPDMVDSWTFREWADEDVIKVIGIPPYPTEVGGSLAACAAGEYDGHWRELAENVKSTGIAASTVVRLGWEMNGDWYPWSAWNPDEFIGCWHRVVSAAESVAPELRWDWTVNAGNSGSLLQPTEAYPGDEWVDIIGVDSYDNWPMATSPQTWREGQLEGPYRLAFWLQFAKEHGKQLSIPEWGTYLEPGRGETTRTDNAHYIHEMVQFFRANADHIAYESFFNEPGNDYHGAITDPVQLPQASAAYLEHYSPS